MTTEKVYTPLPPPDDLYKRDTLPPLTERERKAYNEVYRHFSKASYKLPGTADGDLSEDERFWLSYECIIRFLRGTRWKTADTIQRLESTLAWRRDFGLYSHVNASSIEPEAVTGKQILLGYDTQGRPAFYMIPNKQITSNETRLVQFSVFMLERCIDLMPPGVETLNFLISFPSSSSQPSLTSTRTILSTLQTHYPERLGHATLTNPPLILNILIKFALAFIDPITRAKCKFDSISLLKEDVFKPEGLMKGSGWGGNLDFEFQYKRYWPELLRITEERRKLWRERWRELGGGVGVREWVYKRPAVVGRASSDSEFIGGALRDVDVNANGGSKLHYRAISVTVDCGDDDSRDHKSPWVVIGSPERSSGDESGSGGD